MLRIPRRATLPECRPSVLRVPPPDDAAEWRSSVLRVARWATPPFHASLFGSAARGDGNAASDIDVLVVRPKDIEAEDPRWRGQLDELADRVFSWTGNHAGMVELEEAGIPRLLEDPPPVIEEIAEQGIDLAGLSVQEMVKGS